MIFDSAGMFKRLRTRPGLRDWMAMGLLAAGFTALAVPFGLAAGVLVWNPVLQPERLLPLALSALVFPALGEEAVFRGLLLPDRRGKSKFFWIGLSLTAYVAWHPFAAWVLLPEARPLFMDPAFLAIVTGLGGVLTVSVLRSGSLWPGVILHWLVVVIWKAFLGGPDWLPIYF